MKKLIFILPILLLFLSVANGQIYDQGIFGTATASTFYDTCGVGTDSLVSLEKYHAWRAMRGSLTLHGKCWILSGQVRTFTATLFPLYASDEEYGPNKISLGTITVTDSVTWAFNVSGNTAWHLMKGYFVSFVPDSTTSSTRFKAGELYK